MAIVSDVCNHTKEHIIICNVMAKRVCIFLCRQLFQWLSCCLCDEDNVHCQRSYGWIAHQMHIGTALACLLSRSNFKSETSFVFPSPNYTGQSTCFVKPQNGLVTLVFEKRCFPGGFQGQKRPFEPKSIF